MVNRETVTKFLSLESISSIEDNYLEAATAGVLKKKLFFKISQYSQENNCVGVWGSKSLFNKVAGLQACNFIEKRLQHRCFPVHITN